MKKFTDKINESVENGIPTAEEFFISVVGENPDEFNGYIKECMIEFAKLHVEAALKEASKKAVVEYTDKKFSEIDMYEFADYTWKNSPNTHPEYDEEMLKRPNQINDNLKKNSILKDSILKSYPLDNIK